jgi:hypothetical protein
LPPDQVLMLAQQSWALVYTGDPRAGESAASQALVIAGQAGDAAITVWALAALQVTLGRQGRYGEALDCARRAAGLAAGSHDMRSLPLHPKVFLGLALSDCDLVGEARAAGPGVKQDPASRSSGLKQRDRALRVAGVFPS